MTKWYIDRSKNISSIIDSQPVKNLRMLITSDLMKQEKISPRDLINFLGLRGKNENATLTNYRDLGLIDSTTNKPTPFFVACDKVDLDVAQLILMILLKRNNEKHAKSNVKPFVVICKTLALMIKMGCKPTLSWGDCNDYLMTINDYNNITESFVAEMIEQNPTCNESTVLDIWFNALIATGLFEGTKYEVTLKEIFYPFVEFIANYGHEMIPSENTKQYFEQVASAEYGWYTLVQHHPLEAIKAASLLPALISYIGVISTDRVLAQNTGIEYVTGAKLRDSKGSPKTYDFNRIVFGAPGTGKSYELNKEIEMASEYDRVTFHPDYSYANFVGTYKPIPTEDGLSITYAYVPGPFMRMLAKAYRSAIAKDGKTYILVIEEINRSNVAAVFGDVFQLLDRNSKGVSTFDIQTTLDMRAYLTNELNCAPGAVDKIKLPDNFYLWATMNSADQGVFPMDTAFKRRWDFTYIGLDDNEEKIKQKTVVLAGVKIKWNALRKAINAWLSKEGVNEDKLLGPYFIASTSMLGDEVELDAAEFSKVFKNKVLMYLFEDAAKAKRKQLFDGCDDTKRNRYSEICKEFDTHGIAIFNRWIQEQTLSQE